MKQARIRGVLKQDATVLKLDVVRYFKAWQWCSVLFLLMLLLFHAKLLQKAAVKFFSKFAATFQEPSDFQGNSNSIRA